MEIFANVVVMEDMKCEIGVEGDDHDYGESKCLI